MDQNNELITSPTKRRTVTFELDVRLDPWYTKLPPQTKGFHVNEAITEGLSHVEPTVDLDLMDSWLRQSEARLSSLETDNYLLRQAVVMLQQQSEQSQTALIYIHEQMENLEALVTTQTPL